MSKAIDLSKPRYDQETYIGRVLHFVSLTNPLNILATNSQLEEAKKVVTEFKRSQRMPQGYDENKLWRAKYLVDSAFHPDTGEKLVVIGRMAAQAPMNTVITAGMLIFYKTTAQTVFWQWINQTFNAVVNYSNRSGKTPISSGRLLMSYTAACTGAVGTALFLSRKAKQLKNPLFARLVPFGAVCAANCINIPMMRSGELQNGTQVYTKSGTYVGDSTAAAQKGVTLVVLSRIFMAAPSMVLLPYITTVVASRGVFCRRPRLELPFQVAGVALCVLVATPLCCAIFKQCASIPCDSLESPVKEKAMKMTGTQHPYVYFNKGL